MEKYRSGKRDLFQTELIAGSGFDRTGENTSAKTLQKGIQSVR